MADEKASVCILTSDDFYAMVLDENDFVFGRKIESPNELNL
jgi:hypothetical protein